MMKKIISVLLIAVFAIMVAGCAEDGSSSQQSEQRMQEQTQKESIAQTGQPAIKNFRNKKMLKDIQELCDQDGLTTYTYIVAQQTGKLILLGETIGFPIPYATQYNNPQQLKQGYHEYIAYPQADPDGLYKPANAEGSWVLMVDKKTKKARPVYIEERVICSPFPLEQ